MFPSNTKNNSTVLCRVLRLDNFHFSPQKQTCEKEDRLLGTTNSCLNSTHIFSFHVCEGLPFCIYDTFSINSSASSLGMNFDVLITYVKSSSDFFNSNFRLHWTMYITVGQAKMLSIYCKPFYFFLNIFVTIKSTYTHNLSIIHCRIFIFKSS